MTDQPLSGQQIQAIQQQATEALRKTVVGMELRRVAVQFAIQGGSAPAAELILRAKMIYDFLAAPAAEVRVTLE